MGVSGRLLIALLLSTRRIAPPSFALPQPVLQADTARTYYDLLDIVLGDTGDWEAVDAISFSKGWPKHLRDPPSPLRKGCLIYSTDDEARNPTAGPYGRGQRFGYIKVLQGTANRLFAGRCRPYRANARLYRSFRNASCWKHSDIVRELTGQSRDRRYAYQRYVEILSEGTEPL